ncbi:hypothetical protein H0H93_010497 [Arthromyces matolae]|nr:hypothetical protein H0H93_010497 [Arthromyces matolae]
MRPQAQGQAPRNLPPSIPGRSRNIAGGILNTPDPQLDTLMTSLASPYPPETIANQLLRRWIEVLTDRTKYQSFLARRGEEAKKYLDELQTLIDSIGEKHHFRLMLVVGLFRLTRTSEICPESLLIKDVKYDMNGHVGDGSFGTVFRGTCRGYDICVKILKVKDSDRRTLGARRKVNYLCSLCLWLRFRLNHQAFLREGVLAVQQMHENVLPHYGIYELKDQNDRIALITPYMPKGNLSKYLESCPPNGNRLYLQRLAL